MGPKWTRNVGSVEDEMDHHLELFSSLVIDKHASISGEVRASPLFSGRVQTAVTRSSRQIFPAYGLLGNCTAIFQDGALEERELNRDNLIYANMQEPWSTFICGQQGAGKSYTMSCLLENALIKNGPMGANPRPMAGVVFHYDKFTSSHATQVCEAAYLSSRGIKVQVLVSPSNLDAMKKLYGDLPGFPKDSPKPEVIPFLFSEKQLNVANMKTLMAVDSTDANPPLYMAIMNKILKDMAIASRSTTGIRYEALKLEMDQAGLTPGQLAPLQLRYNLIESFLQETSVVGRRALKTKVDFNPGTMLIVDLSCPFVTEGDACSLFSIFLSIFLNKRCNHGMIVALDEAHKFLTEAPQAKAFSEDLVQIIRQQRHLGTRVVIATQEPTISPKLLDLCNVAMVHQFGSPAWYAVLKQHLAALGLLTKDSDQIRDQVFKMIVTLKRGEALLFCPKACLDLCQDKVDGPQKGVSQTQTTARDLPCSTSRLWYNSSNEDNDREDSDKAKDDNIENCQIYSSPTNLPSPIPRLWYNSSNEDNEREDSDKDKAKDNNIENHRIFSSPTNLPCSTRIWMYNSSDEENGSGVGDKAKDDNVESGLKSVVPKEKLKLLEDGFMKITIRPKLTADGGRSILASDGAAE